MTTKGNYFELKDTNSQKIIIEKGTKGKILRRRRIYANENKNLKWIRLP